MSIDIKGEARGTEALGSYIRGIKKDLVTRGLLEGLAIEARRRIIKRTSGGRDFRGRSFEPYSEGWRKKRSERGRKTSHVDLEFEGRMLSELEIEAEAASARARVYFPDDKEAAKARHHSVTGVGKSRVRREFFALGEADRRALEKMVDEHLKKVLGDRT